MAFRDAWKRYRVLIVMGAGLVSVHFGWYRLQDNPAFRGYGVKDGPQPRGLTEHPSGVGGLPSAKPST
ncbi:uncharacterized LOC128706665 homolog [Lethenteron reissneri]|uniref:uncharacterized LOC128706665 homolog n=1 Tax=Lethenteron reissneri TaxID=7753 RepID=UPI002AB7EC87|nr:uncharacterized LOC128706665 homolog [Lethenteron reissneri]XP_061429832.1 uncharacterized LOC128706665 homolog [Lethenteron reissneri]